MIQAKTVEKDYTVLMLSSQSECHSVFHIPHAIDEKIARRVMSLNRVHPAAARVDSALILCRQYQGQLIVFRTVEMVLKSLKESKEEVFFSLLQAENTNEK